MSESRMEENIVPSTNTAQKDYETNGRRTNALQTITNRSMKNTKGGPKSCVTSAAEKIKGEEHPASSLSHEDTPGGPKSCVTSAAEKIKGEEHPASSLSHEDTPDLQHSESCSELNPQNDQQVRNEDEDVTRASKGPFVLADGVVKISSPSTEEKPKKDILV